MSDRISEFRRKAAEGKRVSINYPALARRDEEFMSCWLADPGYSFVSQDVVSLEPSVTAHFTKDKRYRWATADGIGKKPYYDGTILMIDDMYLMTASQLPPTAAAIKYAWDTGVFDTWLQDPEGVKKHLKKPRSFAKVCALGLGYGMGAKKLQKTCEEFGTVLSFAEAKEVRAAYWRLFSGLRAFADLLQWCIEKEGAIVNPFWYRITPEPHKAFNAYIQSAASGVLDLYCALLFEAAPWANFVTLIHDESICQVPDDKLQEFMRLSEESVVKLNESLQWSVPIRFGTVVAKTFKDFK